MMQPQYTILLNSGDIAALEWVIYKEYIEDKIWRDRISKSLAKLERLGMVGDDGLNTDESWHLTKAGEAMVTQLQANGTMD